MYYQDVRKLAGNKNLAQKIGHSYPIRHRESSVFNYSWLSLLLLLACQTGFGQIQPKYNPLFNDGVVPSIYITMDADSLNALLDPSNWEEDHEYPATFVWSDGSNRDTLKNVGFRLRGNTSRQSAKKSFKVKFNHFGGKKYQGLSDLNLNGEHNDPSLSRAKIVWDLMRKAGIDAPRANHVLLFVNHEYKGIYLNVEHIDNDYFQARDKDEEGQIFKCFYGCDFKYRGSNPSQYPSTVYEPQNHEDEPNTYDLIEFIRRLNAKDDPNFRCKLEEVFDVDAYLKTMAMEVLAGHWDNPLFNKNNAYVYIPTNGARLEVMAYDVDNTMGVDWFGEDWGDKNIYSWAEPSNDRPLFYNLMSQSDYKTRYGYLIKRWLQTFLKVDSINALVDKTRDHIKPYRGTDIYSGLDYGYSYNDFLNSFESMNDRHVKYGIKEYFAKRLSTANSQLQNTQVSPYFGDIRSAYKNGKYIMSFTAEGMEAIKVEITFRLDNGSWQTLELRDDGMGVDVFKNDNRYHFEWSGTQPATIQLTLKAVDLSNRESKWPVCNTFDYSIGYNEIPKLFINEWMADNTDIKDEAGEAEDWIEIYNAGDEDIYLGQYYLSDNLQKPDKWLMPDITLPVKSWVTFWADEDGSQGPGHANFKLSKDGEFIGIFDNVDNYYAPIDTVRFGLSQTNVAYGRYPDGGPLVNALTFPTPGESNVLSSILEETSLINLFPNPAKSVLTVQCSADWRFMDLLDANGNQVITESQVMSGGIEINTQLLPSGNYFIKLISNSGKQQSIQWLKM
ncbi:MAG: CotH kinase family protein [Saprospiraceae bacterium]|nr:CotH kinase family protein [Saprospiraceae bacterium]